MASASQTASSNRQAMAAQPIAKLQKQLHAPPRNRKLTIPHTWAIRLVCAWNNPLSGGCTKTDFLNLYSASFQSEPLQHCPHLMGAPHHACEASPKPLNAHMLPMSWPYCKHPPERHRAVLRSARCNCTCLQIISHTLG